MPKYRFGVLSTPAAANGTRRPSAPSIISHGYARGNQGLSSGRQQMTSGKETTLSPAPPGEASLIYLI